MADLKNLKKYTRNDEYLYMTLSRMKSDCNFYLGYGNRNHKRLWAGEEKAQISKMKEVHNYLNPKPEWLTMEQIDEFEKQMVVNNV